MFNFIKKQKQNIIITVIMITMMIIGIPLFASATTVTDTEVPTITINRGSEAGRVKTGTELSFTITDASEINYIFTQWDRHIDSSTTMKRNYLEDGLDDYTTYNFKITIPFSDQLGLHELSIAAEDEHGNISNWLDIPYYVVDSEVPEDYVDKEQVKFTFNTPDDYPLEGTDISQGREIKILLEDENDIYVFFYKWVKDQKDEDYAKNAIAMYKPGNEIIIKAPKDQGKYYLQFFAYDGADNPSKKYWTSYNITDKQAPVVELNGSETMQIALGETFTDPGAKWTDNVDGEKTIYPQGGFGNA